MTISCAVLAPNYLTGYMTVLLLFTAVIILAFVTTRWLSNSRLSRSRGKNMHVVERLYLAADKMLLIVLVDDTYYLMSQDKMGIKFISILENFTPEENTQENKFSDILEKFKNGNKDK